MMKISRRRLLSLIGLMGGAWILNKIYYPVKYFLFKPDAKPVQISNKTPIISKERLGKVGVAKGTSLKEMIEESINLIGGAEQFDFKGKEVLIKPNVNSNDQYPATTNPNVIGATVQYLYENGASKVIVCDMSNPMFLPTIQTMQTLGIKKAAEDAGAEVTSFDNGEWVLVKPEKAKHFTEFLIPKKLYNAEKIVNLPVLKTHSIATYTMSLKNFVGTIHPNSRLTLHRSDYLEEMVAEINLAIQPDLVIMDATKSMVAGGPTSGSVKDTKLIISSSDRIAIDLVGLGIVKSFGEWRRVTDIRLWEQRQIKRAIELGLGATNADEINVKWTALEEKDQDELENLMKSTISFINE